MKRTRDSGPLERVVVGSLSVWRITHLLQAEDGPWDAVLRVRRAAGQGFSGELLDCFDCLSLWIGAAVACAVGRDGGERAMLWPALSAGAMLLERVTATPAAYFEDQGDEHVLWGKEATALRE
jgi:hypothetical protein